jgi:hypothetical protein
MSRTPRRPRLLALLVVLAALAVAAGGCGGGDEGDEQDDASASTTAPPSSETTTSATPTGWWCHPDLPDDPCTGADLRTTRIAWDGNRTADDDLAAVPDAPADCFAVTPTAADDASGSEWARIDMARFRSLCRLFVPIHRPGEPDAVDAAFAELVAASDRPIVLIGHREGADAVTRVLRDTIDADPALRARLVAAYLVGGTAALQVTSDTGAGATLPNIPICVERDQLGCVISYHVFEDGNYPALGAAPFPSLEPGNRAVCVNPSGLDGSKGQLRAATFPTSSPLPDAPLVTGIAPVETPFVTLTEYYVAECLRPGDGTWYLWLGRSIDPDDQRFPDGLTDPGAAEAHRGVHRHDLALTQGDLLDLLATQLEHLPAS